MTRAIVLNPNDNVATLIDAADAGASVVLQGEAAGSVTLHAAIPFGHKVCVRSTPAGGDILKYGQVIGQASRDLAVGEHVHIHNIESARGRGDKAGDQA
jgi:altronate dehydratase small subunit